MDDYSKQWARQNERQNDLKQLIAEHYKHDLQPRDREILEAAQTRASLYTRLGAVFGLALGLTLGIRLRAARRLNFQTFTSRPPPTSVVYADGRTQPFPDLTRLLRPSRAGDVGVYLLTGGVGMVLGMQTGAVVGVAGVMRGFKGEGEEEVKARGRVERAWRGVRVGLLRRQAEEMGRRADELERMGEGGGDGGGEGGGFVLD